MPLSYTELNKRTIAFLDRDVYKDLIQLSRDTGVLISSHIRMSVVLFYRDDMRVSKSISSNNKKCIILLQEGQSEMLLSGPHTQSGAIRECLKRYVKYMNKMMSKKK